MAGLEESSFGKDRKHSASKESNVSKFLSFSDLASSPVNSVPESRNVETTKSVMEHSFSEWRDPKSTNVKLKTMKETDKIKSSIAAPEKQPVKKTFPTELSDKEGHTNISSEFQKKIALKLSPRDVHSVQQQLTQKKKLYNSVSLSKLPDNGERLRKQIDELETALSELKVECKSVEPQCKGYSAELKKTNDCYEGKSSSLQNEKHKSKDSGTKELTTTLNCPSSLKQDDSSRDNTIENAPLSCEVDKASRTYKNVSHSSSEPCLVNPEKLLTDDNLNIEQDKAEKTQVNASQRQTKLLDHVKPLPKHVIQEMNAKKFSFTSYRDKKETKTVTEDAILKLHSSLEACPTESEVEDPELLKSTLMPHQKQALAWLIWREKQKPRGGILADDMGLGKTITMISLILKHKEKRLQGKPATTKCELEGRVIFKSRSTLVICPASLLHQWNEEIKRHCHQGALKVALYHGPDRERNPEKLGENDVVITTYNLVSKEIGSDKKKDKDSSCQDSSKSPVVRSGESVFLKIAWERIILDEAHTIKNHKSQAAQSIFQLLAKYRWALTGTPIHNDLLDLFALIRFLQCSPFDDYSVWKKMVGNKSAQSTARLNTLVKSLLLRRTKDQKASSGTSLVNLPSRKVITYDLELSEKEKRVYETLFALSRSSLETYLKQQEKKDPTSKNFEKENKDAGTSMAMRSSSGAHHLTSKISGSFLLVLLLRLQQCCNHLSLLHKAIEKDHSLNLDESDKELSDVVSQLPNLNLEERQNETDKQDADPTVKNVMSSDDNLNSLGLEKFYDDPSFCITSESTKVTAILKTLKKIRKMSSGPHIDKCVLVSQWVSMLDVIAYHLDEAGIRNHSIRGSMKPQERMAVVDDFNNNPEGAEVMLLSLKAGGVGLNLIGANHLFLIDSHWNPALQEQACDRIYRVGQKKDVSIHRFIVKNTVEQKILQFQEQKLLLARSVLSGTAKKGNRLTVEDLRLLFTM